VPTNASHLQSLSAVDLALIHALNLNDLTRLKYVRLYKAIDSSASYSIGQLSLVSNMV